MFRISSRMPMCVRVCNALSVGVRARGPPLPLCFPPVCLSSRVRANGTSVSVRLCDLAGASAFVDSIHLIACHRCFRGVMSSSLLDPRVYLKGHSTIVRLSAGKHALVRRRTAVARRNQRVPQAASSQPSTRHDAPFQTTLHTLQVVALVSARLHSSLSPSLSPGRCEQCLVYACPSLLDSLSARSPRGFL